MTKGWLGFCSLKRIVHLPWNHPYFLRHGNTQQQLQTKLATERLKLWLQSKKMGGAGRADQIGHCVTDAGVTVGFQLHTGQWEEYKSGWSRDTDFGIDDVGVP